MKRDAADVDAEIARRVSPDDEHDKRLLANVHPPGWRNPEPAPRYQLVAIGGGTAGLVSAAAAAQLGARVALVERHLMGGDCLATGCVPSKAILRSARFQADVRNADALGAKAQGTSDAFPAVMERMRRLRAKLSLHDSVHRLREMGVDVFLGQARFRDRESLEVDGRKVRFRKAVIATGARPTELEIEGLKEAGYLTSETVFNLKKRPGRLLVVGGGPLGCELAQAFSRLGCQVVIVQKEPQFLPREERDAAQILAQAFEREGIQVRLNTEVTRVTLRGGEKAALLMSEGNESAIAVDEILAGPGRAPNVQGLGLEKAGVAYDASKGIRVDDHLRTTNPRIFAAGDVCLDTKFTHMADETARIVVQNALFLGRRKLSSLTVPWCTYTDPEIAHVGISVREAMEKEIPVKTFTIPMHDVDRAVTDSEEEGFFKVHVREGTDEILGATVVSRHAGEMISEITLAMEARVGLARIARVIHPYPTQAEAIRKAADAYNRSRLTPFRKRLLSGWFAWGR